MPSIVITDVRQDMKRRCSPHIQWVTIRMYLVYNVRFQSVSFMSHALLNNHCFPAIQVCGLIDNHGQVRAAAGRNPI